MLFKYIGVIESHPSRWHTPFLGGGKRFFGAASLGHFVEQPFYRWLCQQKLKPAISAYQCSFKASWICRDVRWNSSGAPAEVIVPAAGLPICALGLLNCGVLNTLNASARNCRCLLGSSLK